MEALDFEVRNLKEEDIPQAVEIHKETGWHTGINTIYTWLEVDPYAFKVAVTNEGKVLAVCSAVCHTKDLYFFGYFVVRKSYRGKGIGKKVMNFCLEHIGSRNVGLNSVPEKLEMYRLKWGFNFVEEQWAVIENDTTEDIIKPENLSDTISNDIDIIPLHESHLHSIFEYDFKVCGYRRGLTIKLSCKEKDCKTYVAFQKGVCVGYGMVRRSVQDVPLVGPLYADEVNIAEVMLRRLLFSYPLKKGISMVTFTNNKGANDILRKIGCPPTHRLPRIYRREPDLNISTQRVFAHFDVNCSPV